MLQLPLLSQLASLSHTPFGALGAEEVFLGEGLGEGLADALGSAFFTAGGFAFGGGFFHKHGPYAQRFFFSNRIILNLLTVRFIILIFVRGGTLSTMRDFKPAAARMFRVAQA
jgi:hypothetical protein